MVLLCSYSLKWKILSTENAQFPVRQTWFRFFFPFFLFHALVPAITQQWCNMPTILKIGMNAENTYVFFAFHFSLRFLSPTCSLLLRLFFSNVTGNRTRASKRTKWQISVRSGFFYYPVQHPRRFFICFPPFLSLFSFFPLSTTISLLVMHEWLLSTIKKKKKLPNIHNLEWLKQHECYKVIM